MKLRALAFTLFAFLAACTTAIDRPYRGLYVYGHEVHTFTPCQDAHTWWVSASSWTISPLHDFYRKHTRTAYQPVYIEFRGHLLNEKVDGFAADYDGLIRISKITRQREDIPGDCNASETSMHRD